MAAPGGIDQERVRTRERAAGETNFGFDPPASFRGTEAVARQRGLCRLQDQRVRDTVEYAEHEEQADALVGQLDQRTLLDGLVVGDRPFVPQRQHVAALEAVVRAAIDRDDLVDAGRQRVAVQRDHSSVHFSRRRVRDERSEVVHLRRHQAIADFGVFAVAGDREARRYLEAAGRGARTSLSVLLVLGRTDIARFVAQHRLGIGVDQGFGGAEDLPVAGIADRAAHVSGFAPAQQDATFLGGDDARRRGELVGVENHRVGEERRDQIHGDGADGARFGGFAANRRRQFQGVADAAHGVTEFEPGDAVDFLQHQQLAGIDQVRVVNLFEIHSPQLGPAPRAFQEHAGNGPQRIAALDGIRVGGVGSELGQGHALARDFLRGRTLRGRDGKRRGLRHGWRGGQDGQRESGAVQGSCRPRADGTWESKGHVQKTPGPLKAIGTEVRRKPREVQQFRIGWSIQPAKKLANLPPILPANP
jgi:hypothetical protein